MVWLMRSMSAACGGATGFSNYGAVFCFSYLCWSGNICFSPMVGQRAATPRQCYDKIPHRGGKGKTQEPIGARSRNG